MSLVANNAPDISLLFWGVSATPLFLTIEMLRVKNVSWILIYGGLFLACVALGFFWPLLPKALAALLETRSEKIFLFGAFSSAILYAFVRRRWVKFGDRRLVSGFGEGIAVFVFIALVCSPLFDEELVARIFVAHNVLFVFGGVAGLALVLLDTASREKEGELLASYDEEAK